MKIAKINSLFDYIKGFFNEKIDYFLLENEENLENENEVHTKYDKYFNTNSKKIIITF